MNFEEKIEDVYQAILSSQNSVPTARIQKNKTIMLTMLHSYRYKMFQRDFLKITYIRNALCLAFVDNLIDIADIYILNAFIANLSMYTIDINYLKQNYPSLSYAMQNCEKNSNILKQRISNVKRENQTNI